MKRIYPILLASFISSMYMTAKSQNVSINTTGSTGNATAILDLNTGNTFTSPNAKGMLIPNVSLTSTTDITTVAGPVNSLLVYNTNAGITGVGANGVGYYYYSTGAAKWINLIDNYAPGSPWLLNGNALTNPPTDFIGTTDAKDLAFKTNNAERMRILSGGNVGINVTAPNYFLDVEGSVAAGRIAYVLNTNAAGYGLRSANTGAVGTNITGYGMIGATAQNVASIAAFNYYGVSDGVGFGGSQGATGMYNQFAGGAGGAFTGVKFGMSANNTNCAVSSGAIWTQNGCGDQMAFNYYSAGGTLYKCLSGSAASVSCSVPDSEGKMRVMHATETPEFYFQDYGESQLINGKSHIDIDPILAKNITVNDKHPMRVYVQLEGDCNGVYISNKTQTGFDVVELKGGQSNIKFQWTVICNVADVKGGPLGVIPFADLRFEPAPDKLQIITISDPDQPRK